MSIKQITLCADDYALHTAVSKGIVHLAEKGRLTAVNCLTTSPDWSHHAEWLQPHRNQLDVGLHFNLTDGKPLSAARSLVTSGGTFQSLSAWMIKTHLHLVKQADIENELLRQLERFTQYWQRLPDFIDGHQYVHHLPVVRKALLNVYEKQLRQHHPYIRIALQRGGGKPRVIAATGAFALSRQCQARNIPHNTTFSGIYPFQNATRYRHYFKQFLTHISDGGLMVCHPGFASDHKKVPWAAARVLELNYLGGDLFSADCEQHQVRLARFAT